MLVHGGSGDWGSSPLARGTPLIPAHQAAAVGLIPARAGNTIFSRFSTVPAWAHPRSRGEHGFAVVFPAPGGGSSPLARGTHPYCHPARTRNGLIPARAGNTSRCGHSVRPGRAHPRSRGEHIDASELFVAQKGSSPLARGTRFLRRQGNQGRGLIPARAGNTTSSSSIP